MREPLDEVFNNSGPGPLSSRERLDEVFKRLAAIEERLRQIDEAVKRLAAIQERLRHNDAEEARSTG